LGGESKRVHVASEMFDELYAIAADDGRHDSRMFRFGGGAPYANVEARDGAVCGDSSLVVRVLCTDDHVAADRVTVSGDRLASDLFFALIGEASRIRCDVSRAPGQEGNRDDRDR